MIICVYILQDEESCSVMLKGAPPHVAERDVFDFFSDIGLVPSNVKIMYDTNGSCNGQIVCEFLDPHKARRATTKDGMLFGRGHVEVQLVTTGRKRGLDLANLAALNKSHRPALLGPRPMLPSGNPRYAMPFGPNPFVQAFQGVNGTPPRPTGSHGTRPRGPHPSRFSARNEFDSTTIDIDDRLGGGRGRNSSASHVVEDDVGGMPQFGKPGIW